MKKLIVFAGVLIALSAILESCGSSQKVPRPQRHPRYPRKMAMVSPVQVTNATVVVLG